MRCNVCSDCKQELELMRRLDTRRSVKFSKLESLREERRGDLRMTAR